MQTLDYLIFGTYIAIMIFIGIYAGKKIKNTSDMFNAGGKSPWWISGLSSYMTMFSAGSFVVWGGIAYRQGAVAITILLCFSIAALLAGFFVAGKWYRMGLSTPVEYINQRFGQRMVKFYTFFGIFYRLFALGMSLYSLSILFDAIYASLAGDANLLLIIICVSGVLIILYTMMGGLWAVLISDFMQFAVLTVSVIVVVIFAIMYAGGFGTLVRKLPEGHLRFFTSDYDLVFMVFWIATQFLKIGGEWAYIQRFTCVPSEKDAKKSAFLFAGIAFISPFLWMIPPMFYTTIDPNANPEQAYILACKSVLPPGFMGLIFSAMFSASASTISGELNVFSGIITKDIYEKFKKQVLTEKHLVMAGRVFTVLLGLIVIVLAINVPNFGGAERVVILTTGMLGGPMLVPVVWSLFSDKLKERHIWISLLLVAVIAILVNFILPNVLSSDSFISHLLFDNTQKTELIMGIGIPALYYLLVEIYTKHLKNT